MAKSTRNTATSATKQALVELKRMQARLDAAESARTEAIAICGMGMRFPGGAVDAESYWQLLSNGVDAITEIPESRWKIDEFYDPDPDAPGKTYSRHGGFLEGIEDFDAEFFGLSPREAVSTDPQQRLLLEVCWEALENAAIAPDSLARSRSGVYIGVGNSDYGRMLVADPDRIDVHTGTGSAIAAAAGRLSYVLGLSGPSLIVDTACSSSLTAIALACESLRRRECDLALAGGCNLILTPEYNIAFSKARMLAADGRCKAFDARADGYVRGEGCGVVVLKRLSDALRDGDPILAQVRGVAVNQDGASSGLTVPNGPAQEAVVRAALQSGGIGAQDVDYVEAHGTATSLGDPIEVHALGAVFGDRPAERPLQIGSVKSNIGHLEAAAGIASVIKVVLALQHEQIPPSLHFEQPSPHIDWQRSPVRVATALTRWPDRSGQKLAGVSSFGFSGTNAHLILGQAPARASTPVAADGPQLMGLSATDPDALRALAARYAVFLEHTTEPLADIAWTANTGRSHRTHRIAVVGDDAAQMRSRLLDYSEHGRPTNVVVGEWFDSEPPPVAFLFTGDRSPYYGMGRGYYERYAEFRDRLDDCDRLLQSHAGESLVERLFDDAGDRPWTERDAFGQPALFSLQVALASLWRSWGVEPDVVLGHGLGEYAAAFAAGVFDLESGLALTAARGRLFDTAERRRLADDGVASANLGDAPVFPASAGAEREQFERIAERIDYSLPALTIVSTRTGGEVDSGACDPRTWVEEPGAATRLWPAVRSLYDGGQRIFLEVGPQPVLSSLASSELDDADCSWLAVARKGRGDRDQIAETAAGLYVRGLDLAWAKLSPSPGRRISMPTYPFQRARYWWSMTPGRTQEHLAVPAWGRVLDAGRQQALQVPIDMDVGSYERKWHCLERLSVAYMVDTLTSFGSFSSAGDAMTAAELCASCDIKPVYEMLMSRWLQHLADAGLLQRKGNRFRSSEPLVKADIGPLLQEAREALGDIPALQEYVERCGTMLRDVLLGRESSLQTLFPGGSNETATFLYRDWAVPRYFNQIVAATVERFVSAKPHRGPVRLLEIGAGTGATTAAVLPRIAAHEVDYVFTDVSDFFLGQAREAFADHDFVRYGLLDISKDPAAQGFGRHGFDVVIAANVLHATSHLEETIDHVLSSLAPGGILVLFETTNAPLWSDVTVSLIEGWQSFSDSLRTDSPLLAAPQWSELLRARGFDELVVLPESGSPAERFGSHVVVAQVAGEAVAVRVADDAPAAVAATATMPVDADRSSGAADFAGNFRSGLDDVADNEREAMLVEFVRDCVNRVLRRSSDKPLDRRQRLMDLGVDSLMAVELRNLLTAGLGFEEPLPATLIFDYPTVEAVAAFLDTRLGGAERPGAETAAVEAASEQRRRLSEEDVDVLSDEEIKAMLEQRIGED